MVKLINIVLYCFSLIVLSFALGCFVGETMAPISGISMQALEARAARLEIRAESLAERCKKVEALAEEVRQANAVLEMHRERTSRH